MLHLVYEADVAVKSLIYRLAFSYEHFKKLHTAILANKSEQRYRSPDSSIQGACIISSHRAPDRIPLMKAMDKQ